jgi:hypothetical protein
MRGGCTSSCGITRCRLGLGHIRGWPIGSSTCQRRASARCVAGSGFAPLPASPNGARSVPMPASALPGGAMRSIPDLAEATVLVWFGFVDDPLYVECHECRFGPYRPVDGPSPLQHSRQRKKTRPPERADRIALWAEPLGRPRAALPEPAVLANLEAVEAVPRQLCVDPDPFHDLALPNALEAKRAIAEPLGQPLATLATLPTEQ